MAKADIDRGSNMIAGILVVAVFVAVLLLAVAIVYQAMDDAYVSYEGRAYTQYSATNESGAYINSTGYTLSLTSSCDQDYSISTIYNASDGVVIASGNYTVSDAGVLTNATATTWSDVNVTYTCNEDVTADRKLSSEYSNVQTDVSTMITNFFSLAPTIGTILAVVILIAVIVILVMYVARMRSSGSAEYGFAG